MPLILAKCPRFKPTWEKYQKLWQGEEAGIYNDLGEFATLIVDSYAKQDIDPTFAAFALLEEVLVGFRPIPTAIPEDECVFNIPF